MARNLAAAFLAGSWTHRGLVERAAQACGKQERWLSFLARRVRAAFSSGARRPEVETIAQFINSDNGFSRAWTRLCQHQGPALGRVFWVTPAMRPAPGTPASWAVVPLDTLDALAAWLELTPGELDWLSGRYGRSGTGLGPLEHYTYRWIKKASGRQRLLEVPKRRLKAIQRRLLHEILDRIPPHGAVHGYRAGRSVATYAAPHTSRRIVIHLDLCDFFPSIRAARVHGLFATAGYPRAVARALTGLCTNLVPEEILRCETGTRRRPEECDRLLRSPHLPQGAPTSPALANLCAYRLDCRLAGLARSMGAVYTRYADDLAFSGDGELERSCRRFQVHVCRIALEEGFEVHTRKTRFMRRGVRQQLAGVVVNARANIRRTEFDSLKAILHNCACHGPRSQNREGRKDFQAHLAGRIAYVQMLNPERGARLRDLFQQIAWTELG